MKNEKNDKLDSDLEKMYTKFNKGFNIRDDVNTCDLLLLSSEDLGFVSKVSN